MVILSSASAVSLTLSYSYIIEFQSSRHEAKKPDYIYNGISVCLHSIVFVLSLEFVV